MLAFAYDGDAYITLQYNGDVLDAATALDEWILSPKREYPHYCYFTAGQSTSLVDGVKLTGQTSGAVIKVGRVITTGGALGSSTGAGILFFYKVSGELVSGENLRVSTTTYAVAGSGALDSPLVPARSAFVSVETNSIRIACGGVSPTNAAGTPASFGVLLQNTQSTVVGGWKSVRTLKMINAASGSSSSTTVIVNF
jgi:hypothetical protein